MRQIVRISGWPWLEVGKFGSHRLAKYQSAHVLQDTDGLRFDTFQCFRREFRTSTCRETVNVENIFDSDQNTIQRRTIYRFGKARLKVECLLVQPDSPIRFWQ